eukprot:TRINITY_DN4002_c0_g1_i5.p1 TRINITY_DN4002_c0_g1~~TRINITY_DN4002_c0_g1_i5.p1  ORF type:complete len:385 (+),score=-47.14 TRINITY_DN4002_c0_g1_i5:64-1218(+)
MVQYLPYQFIQNLLLISWEYFLIICHDLYFNPQGSKTTILETWCKLNQGVQWILQLSNYQLKSCQISDKSIRYSVLAVCLIGVQLSPQFWNTHSLTYYSKVSQNYVVIMHAYTQVIQIYQLFYLQLSCSVICSLICHPLSIYLIEHLSTQLFIQLLSLSINLSFVYLQCEIRYSSRISLFQKPQTLLPILIITIPSHKSKSAATNNIRKNFQQQKKKPRQFYPTFHKFKNTLMLLRLKSIVFQSVFRFQLLPHSCLQRQYSKSYQSYQHLTINNKDITTNQQLLIIPNFTLSWCTTTIKKTTDLQYIDNLTNKQGSTQDNKNKTMILYIVQLLEHLYQNVANPKIDVDRQYVIHFLTLSIQHKINLTTQKQNIETQYNLCFTIT